MSSRTWQPAALLVRATLVPCRRMSQTDPPRSGRVAQAVCSGRLAAAVSQLAAEVVGPAALLTCAPLPPSPRNSCCLPACSPTPCAHASATALPPPPSSSPESGGTLCWWNGGGAASGAAQNTKQPCTLATGPDVTLPSPLLIPSPFPSSPVVLLPQQPSYSAA
jgi:hypothetical protein